MFVCQAVGILYPVLPKDRLFVVIIEVATWLMATGRAGSGREPVSKEKNRLKAKRDKDGIEIKPKVMSVSYPCRDVLSAFLIDPEGRLPVPYEYANVRLMTFQTIRAKYLLLSYRRAKNI